LSSSTAAVESPQPEKPKRARKRIGRARKLDKRLEPKPDGRYLIYYRPS
jgi:hypothetical protein